MPLTVLAALRRFDEGRFRAELYRAWSTGLGAGLSHSVALEHAGRIRSATTEELRRYLIVGTQHERAIATLVKARPNLFDPMEIAILSAGEEAGTLDKSLRILADLHAREFKRMLRLRRQMSYPLFFELVGVFVITQPFIWRGGWKAYLAAIAIALAVFLLVGGFLVTVLAGMASGGATYALPRFVWALVAGIEAGLPAGPAARLAASVSQSAELRLQVAKRPERDFATTPLASLLEGSRVIPPALTSQLRVADATGDYLATLKRYALQEQADE